MKTYLDGREIELLEKVAGNLRDQLLIRLLSRLGCRVSEALGLTVDDIDLAQGLITIEHLKTRLNLQCPSCGTHLGRKHVFCPVCGKRVEEVISKARAHRRVRTLPVDQDTVSMLKEFIKQSGPVEKNDRKFVFGINRHRAWQIVKRCAEQAGLPELVNPETGRRHGVSPHRLRDGIAVRAKKTDSSADGLRLLQEHLGHASFNTTARYRKIGSDEHREWYDRLWTKGNDSRGT